MSYAKPPILPAWGESNTTSADMIQPTTGQIAAGWPLSSTPPSRQRFNWILNFCANAVRYFMQRGLVDFDLSETYQAGARVIGDDGNSYMSLVNGNIGHAPSTSPAYWGLWALTLDQIDAATLTQATATAGDSSNKVANTAFVTSAISTAITSVMSWATSAFTGTISLGASGWIKFPAWAGGFCIQWGNQTGLPDASFVTVNFPGSTQFGTVCYGVVAVQSNNNGANNRPLAAVVLSKTQFEIQATGSGANAFWIAVGK